MDEPLVKMTVSGLVDGEDKGPDLGELDEVDLDGIDAAIMDDDLAIE